MDEIGKVELQGIDYFPKGKIQSIQNISICLEYMASLQIRLLGINAGYSSFFISVALFHSLSFFFFFFFSNSFSFSFSFSFSSPTLSLSLSLYPHLALCHLISPYLT
jgi:hypothetical protein